MPIERGDWRYGCWFETVTEDGSKRHHIRYFWSEEDFRLAFFDALTKHKDIGKALDEIKAEMNRQLRRM